jgi:protein ImuA
MCKLRRSDASTLLPMHQKRFVMVRPLATAQDASPVVLRLALRPSADGLIVDIVK